MKYIAKVNFIHNGVSFEIGEQYLLADGEKLLEQGLVEKVESEEKPKAKKEKASKE